MLNYIKSNYIKLCKIIKLYIKLNYNNCITKNNGFNP